MYDDPGPPLQEAPVWCANNEQLARRSLALANSRKQTSAPSQGAQTSRPSRAMQQRPQSMQPGRASPFERPLAAEAPGELRNERRYHESAEASSLAPRDQPGRADI